MIMPSCGAGDALGLATRLHRALGETEFEPAGRVTVSVGVAEGPGACDEPARADRLRRGRDDDGQGPGQEPDRAVRRARPSARLATPPPATTARSRT